MLRAICCQTVNLGGQAGNYSSGLVPVNDPFGDGFLDNRDGVSKVLSCLINGFVCHGSSDPPNRFLGACPVTLVSYPSDLVLSGPLKGRFMICQILTSMDNFGIEF